MHTGDPREIRFALLGHSGGMANLGVGALTWSNIALLRRAAEQVGATASFTLIVTGEPVLDRVDDLGPNVDVRQMTIPSKPSWMPSAFVRLWKVLCTYDVVVDLSAGDSFASIYGRPRMVSQTFAKATALATRRPLILAPQTLGPFSRPATWAARAILVPAAVVCARDEPSAAIARRFRRRPVHVVPDVAFALAPIPTAPFDAATTHVGINVSGLLYNAPDGAAYAVPGYQEYVDRLLDALCARPDVTVHLAPHVVGDDRHATHDEDHALARSIAAARPEVICPERFATPGEAKGYIGNLDVLVTSRMHAGIAALSSGKPVIAVAYSRKFRDTLATVGYDAPVVDLRQASPEAATLATLAFIDDRAALADQSAAARARAEERLDDYVDVVAAHLTALAAPTGRRRSRTSSTGMRTKAGPTCVERVVADGLCIGCGACAVLAGPAAITMGESPSGFLVPEVRDAAAVDAIAASFDAVCPGRSVTGMAVRQSRTWGPVETMVTGHAVDDEVRFLGSSGGVLSALCGYLLDSGRVDAVLTMFAAPDSPLRPVPRLVRDAGDLHVTAGSRYCPSSPLAALADVTAGERIAFVGKPCDVAALRGLLTRDAALRAQVVVLLSFFCAGIPSFSATDDLVRQLGHEPDEVVTFRYRGAGWPGRATVRTADDEASMSYHESWGGLLAGKVHERCKICPDATGELADISCGDAWFEADGGPGFDEAPGRSVVIVRTPLGTALLRQAQEAGAIETQPYTSDELLRVQPYQAARKAAVVPRLAGRALMGSRVPRYRRLGLLASTRRLSLRRIVSEARGSAFRVRRDHPRRWHRLLRRG